MAIAQISGCVSCGTCITTCPADVIHLNSNSNKAFIKYPDECQNCHLCWIYCPVDAIQYAGSVDTCGPFWDVQTMDPWMKNPRIQSAETR